MSLMSYPGALALHARRSPQRTAIVCGSEQRSYAALAGNAARLARVFAGRGVGEGAFVALALENSPRHVECWFAAWSLGAIPLPISARLPAAERDAILELASPALVVGPDAPSCAGFPCLPTGGELDASPAPPLADRVSTSCQALTSGGSTGRPKIIVDATAAEWDPGQPFYGNAPGSTVLVPGPLHHAGPFINTKVTLLGGGTVVLQERFDAAAALSLI